MSTNRSSNENPAEPKSVVVTVAEAGLPENPEIVANSSLELISQEDKSNTEKTEDSNNLTKEEKDKPEVTFASEHTSISYEAEEDYDIKRY
ncbi:hypothetical protein M0802_014992 [Mischocyttarus mexicanus]|nr:hypothetical protein M0802_014992 [Mischocyttarus mexicanus]